MPFSTVSSPKGRRAPCTGEDRGDRRPVHEGYHLTTTGRRLCHEDRRDPAGDVLRDRLRPRGGDARAHAGPRRGGRARAREACGLPAGLPRGYTPPLDHGDHGRARSRGRAPRRETHEGPEDRSPPPWKDRYGRGPFTPEDTLPLHHLHAPVGLLGLRDGRGEALPELPPGDGSRSEGADP